MRWFRKSLPYDADEVDQIAGRPVESKAHTPAYMTVEESLSQFLSNRDVVSLQAQTIVSDRIERLEATWEELDERNWDLLHEHAVMYVANKLAIYLRDIAGQPDSRGHASATNQALRAAIAVGEARLAEMPRHLKRSSLHEFFFPKSDSQFLGRVGDQMASAAIEAYVEGLRAEIPKRVDDPWVHN
jgi:hypothetical protein